MQTECLPFGFQNQRYQNCEVVTSFSEDVRVFKNKQIFLYNSFHSFYEALLEISLSAWVKKSFLWQTAAKKTIVDKDERFL